MVMDKEQAAAMLTFETLDWTDARFLSYALGLGGNVRILKRQAGSKDGRGITNRPFEKNLESNDAALKQMQKWRDRTVFVMEQYFMNGDLIDERRWIVAESPSGDAITFESLRPKLVFDRMLLAEAQAIAGEKDGPCALVAYKRLKRIGSKPSPKVVAKRKAAAAWPPKPGTKQAKALAYIEASKEFFMVAVDGAERRGKGQIVSSETVIAKLKDPMLHLMWLAEFSPHNDESRILLKFCLAGDFDDEPIVEFTTELPVEVIEAAAAKAGCVAFDRNDF